VDAEYRAINRQRNAEASTKTRLMKIIEDPRSMLALRPGSQVAKRRVRAVPPQWPFPFPCFAPPHLWRSVLKFGPCRARETSEV